MIPKHSLLSNRLARLIEKLAWLTKALPNAPDSFELSFTLLLLFHFILLPFIVFLLYSYGLSTL